jgi:hypothetical protein
VNFGTFPKSFNEIDCEKGVVHKFIVYSYFYRV